MILTEEQIAKQCEHKDGQANISAINKLYMAQDESKKWPICGKFNATKRAIRRVSKQTRESGCAVYGLEYCYALDNEISKIVNNEDNW